MKQPIFVRALTEGEEEALTAGLRSPDAFVLRRCQALLASANGKRVPEIASSLSCCQQTVRDAIHAFNAVGLAALIPGSRAPLTTMVAFSSASAEHLRALLHKSPRTFGEPTSLWTLELAAKVSFDQGLTPSLVTGETVRATLDRLGVKWKRAKNWITSPDPAYERKKGHGIA